MTTRKSGAAAPRQASAPRKAKVAPATKQDASGAIMEPSIASLPNHPSVDRNPRENSTADMNRIDFNEPSGLTPPEEAVEKNLRGQE